MKYKGYHIGKISNYLFSGGRDGYSWNVCKDYKNVRFSTLREAMEYINKQVGDSPRISRKSSGIGIDFETEGLDPKIKVEGIKIN